MNAPVLILLLPLIIGIIIGTKFNLSFFILLFLSLVIMVSIILLWYYESQFTILLILIFVLLIGIMLIQNLEYQYCAPRSITNYVGKKVKVQGDINKIEQTTKGVDYTLIPREIKKGNQKYKINYGRILVKTDNKKKKYNYGDILEIKGRVQLPPTNRNPGGFSYRRYLKRKEVYAWMQEREIRKINLMGSKGNIVVKAILQFRSRAAKIIDQNINSPYNSLLRGVLLGEKELIPAKIRTDFEKLGLNHFLVISGFHIGLLVLILNSICKGVGLPLGTVDLISISLVGGYVIITYGQPSVVRASLVVVFYILGRRLKRKISMYNILSTVALIMLVINPYYLFQPGFQLSFLIVFNIIYLTPTLSQRLSFLPNFLAGILAASLAAQLGAFPILIYYFNRISFVPILGNILIMPLVSLILFFGFIALLLGNIHLIFAQLLNNINYLLCIILLKTIDFLKKFSFMAIRLPRPDYLLIAVYYFLLYQFKQVLSFEIIPNLRRRKERLIISVVIILLICLGFNLSLYFEDNLEAIFLDVGQGDAAFLKLPGGKNVLIDGGIDKDVVADFLYQNGIYNLELVIISHFHQDHMQGIFRVLKEFKVEKVLLPRPVVKNELAKKIFQLLNERDINYRLVTRAGRLDLNRVNLDIYHYDPNAVVNPNNNSLVVRVNYDDFQILFTGDIESEVERHLVRKRVGLKSEVLKVAHHGSNTSSSKDFLKYVQPQLAVISVGKWNKHNLPALQIIKRLKQSGIQTFATDEQGAVIIESDGKRYWIKE